jgi:hypothetical protein
MVQEAGLPQEISSLDNRIVVNGGEYVFIQHYDLESGGEQTAI